jgi:uncharacterized protein
LEEDVDRPSQGSEGRPSFRKTRSAVSCDDVDHEDGAELPRWPKRKVRHGVDEYGRTPLWYHALNGDVAAVQHELAAGADASAADDVNYTPLHAAVQQGHVPVVELLLASGADANAVDRHGNGPLWTAVMSAPESKRTPIVALLLRAGANPHCKNVHGASPLDVASRIGQPLDLPSAGGD